MRWMGPRGWLSTASQGLRRTAAPSRARAREMSALRCRPLAPRVRLEQFDRFGRTPAWVRYAPSIATVSALLGTIATALRRASIASSRFPSPSPVREMVERQRHVGPLTGEPRQRASAPSRSPASYWPTISCRRASKPIKRLGSSASV